MKRQDLKEIRYGMMLIRAVLIGVFIRYNLYFGILLMILLIIDNILVHKLSNINIENEE